MKIKQYKINIENIESDEMKISSYDLIKEYEFNPYIPQRSYFILKDDFNIFYKDNETFLEFEADNNIEDIIKMIEDFKYASIKSSIDKLNDALIDSGIEYDTIRKYYAVPTNKETSYNTETTINNVKKEILDKAKILPKDKRPTYSNHEVLSFIDFGNSVRLVVFLRYDNIVVSLYKD